MWHAFKGKGRVINGSFTWRYFLDGVVWIRSWQPLYHVGFLWRIRNVSLNKGKKKKDVTQGTLALSKLTCQKRVCWECQRAPTVKEPEWMTTRLCSFGQRVLQLVPHTWQPTLKTARRPVLQQYLAQQRYVLGYCQSGLVPLPLQSLSGRP